MKNTKKINRLPNTSGQGAALKLGLVLTLLGPELKNPSPPLAGHQEGSLKSEDMASELEITAACFRKGLSTYFGHWNPESRFYGESLHLKQDSEMFVHKE